MFNFFNLYFLNFEKKTKKLIIKNSFTSKNTCLIGHWPRMCNILQEKL